MCSVWKYWNWYLYFTSSRTHSEGFLLPLGDWLYNIVVMCYITGRLLNDTKATEYQCIFFPLFYVPFVPEEDTRLFPWKPLRAQAASYHQCAEDPFPVASGSLHLLGTVKHFSTPFLKPWMLVNEVAPCVSWNVLWLSGGPTFYNWAWETRMDCLIFILLLNQNFVQFVF